MSFNVEQRDQPYIEYFRRGFALIVFSFVLVQAAVGQGHTYVGSRFKYQFLVPPKWHIAVSGSGVPVLFNYKESEGAGQGLFPEGGANISLIPFEVVGPVLGVKTMNDWIERNLATDHENVSLPRVIETDATKRSPQHVIEVEADFVRPVPDDELHHEVNYYFTLRGAMFRLMLVYWKDSPQAAEFRSVCQSILRSIKSTETTAK